jgi:O-antigen ligase
MIICLASYLFINDDAGWNNIFSTLLITVFFVSIYGIFQYIFGDPITKTVVSRVKSLLGDPNALGVFLVLTLPIIIVQFKLYYRQWRGYLIAVCLLVGVISLFLTFSRAAWLGFLFSLTPFIYQTVLRIFRQNYLAKKAFPFIFIVSLIVFGGIISGQILTHFQPVSHRDYNLPARVSSITQGNDSGRGLIWSTAWNAFKKSPFVGYGIGSFQVSFHRFKSPAAMKFWSPDRDLREVHNETLHYLATQGIVGLLSYLGLLLALLFAAKISGLFSDILPFEETALWAAIFGYLFYVQFNYPLIHNSFLFWIYWGMLLHLQAPRAKVHLTNYLKPVFLIIAVMLILVWSFLALNIFRADLKYRKAFYESRHHNYKQAFSDYQTAISLTPWNFHYQYRYGISLFRAAVWETETRHFKLSTRFLYLARTNQLYLAKNNSDRYEPLFLLGQIYETLGDFVTADRYYRQALHLYPLNYKISFRLAKVEWLMGNKAEFSKAFRAGSALAPGYMKSMLLNEGIK